MWLFTKFLPFVRSWPAFLQTFWIHRRVLWWTILLWSVWSFRTLSWTVPWQHQDILWCLYDRGSRFTRTLNCKHFEFIVEFFDEQSCFEVSGAFEHWAEQCLFNIMFLFLDNIKTFSDVSMIGDLVSLALHMQRSKASIAQKLIVSFTEVLSRLAAPVVFAVMSIFTIIYIPFHKHDRWCYLRAVGFDVLVSSILI